MAISNVLLDLTLSNIEGQDQDPINIAPPPQKKKKKKKEEEEKMVAVSYLDKDFTGVSYMLVGREGGGGCSVMRFLTQLHG